MLRNPALYSVGAEYQSASDPTLLQKRFDLIHTAAVLLEKCGMVRYERGTGEFFYS